MDLLYKIGLNFIPGIGPKTARKLVAYAGGVKEVFNLPEQKLKKIPGIGQVLAKNIKKNEILKKAEDELKILENQDIKILFYLDKEYPEKLKEFEDSPILLYVKGNFDFKNKKYLAIVGTRKPTDYGKKICETLINGFKEEGINIVVISGLAYGIDYCSHYSALKNNFETLAILGHGLRYLYPSYHKKISKQIIQNGALISEFSFNHKIEPKNFVRRNRIIAALSDAVVVVQSGLKGGSLITAEYAIGYNKPVYTFPGRITDEKMKGCNFLIKTNRAALIENAKDIIFEMNWDMEKSKKQKTKNLFPELSEIEQKLYNYLQENGQVNVDKISYDLNLPINKILSTLFTLEFKELVRALPGRMYEIIN